MPGAPPLALADAFLLERTSVAWEHQVLLQDGLRTLEHGSPPTRIVSLASHQDLYAGLLNAIRVLIGAPLAVALAAIVTFFPLTHGASPVILALSLLPAVCIGCVLSLYLETGSADFVTLVGRFIVMPPSNPQSFDPLAFSERGLLLVMSGAIIFRSLVFLLPASPRRRVFHLADAIARDLETGSAGDAASIVSRNYDRLTQAFRWMGQRPRRPARRAVFARMTALAHLGGAVSRARHHLVLLRQDHQGADAGLAALGGLDPQAMCDSAATLLASAGRTGGATRGPTRGPALHAVSGLYGAAVLTEQNARMMRLTGIIPRAYLDTAR